MRYFFVVILFTFSSLAYSQSRLDSNNVDTTSWLKLLQSSSFTVISKVDKINTLLLSKFPAWKNMSNPGGPFNATDVGSGPRSRLYFVAYSGNHWIVSYEHGGIGYCTYCFFITIDNKDKIHVILTLQTFKSFDELKSFSARGEIQVENWDGYYY